jgi:ankyrin repeat protein
MLTQSDDSGMTPLSLAARSGHEAIVKLILETGVADVTMQDNEGMTALDWADSYYHEAVSKLLFNTEFG